MFLTDHEIKELRFFKNNYELKANTLILHIDREFSSGHSYEDSKRYPGGYMGGFDYPRALSFWSAEEIELDKMTMGIIFGRQSMANRGVLVFPGFVHPGFKGHLLLNSTCLGGKTRVERGVPLAYISFAKLSSEVGNPIDMTLFNRDTLMIDE